MVLRAALLCAAAASDAPVPAAADEGCRIDHALGLDDIAVLGFPGNYQKLPPDRCTFVEPEPALLVGPAPAQKPTKQAVLARFRRFLSDYDQYRGLVDAAEKANGTSAANFLQTVEESEPDDAAASTRPRYWS